MTNLYIIYEIRPTNKELIYSYVGSTKNFIKRKSNHKIACNNCNAKSYNFILYKYIRENGGWINFEMIPLEEYECDTKTQARIREQFFINQIENKLNMIKAYISSEENKERSTEQIKIYRLNNKEQIAEKTKKYQIEHKETITEQTKEYRLKNKEKITENRKKRCQENKEQSKEYRLANKEKIKEKRKIYCLENKEKVAKQRKEYRLKNKKNKLTSVNAESN
jgi:hypothetical protein